MKQFRNYPIYINYSRAGEISEWRADYFQTQGDSKMAEWMNSTGAGLLETAVYTNLSPEAIAYEESIVEQLKIIDKTALGKLLFDSLNPTEKIWIVPLYEKLQNICGCVGLTVGVVSPKQGGGIHVWYDTEGVDAPAINYTPDSILFHEMIHAYRIGRVGFGGQNNQQLREYKSVEEFLAIYMQNVYFALRGNLRFTRSHSRSTTVLSKDEIYSYLSSDAEAMSALRYYLRNEPLAAKVASRMHPLFNPWRDFAKLERIFRGRNPYLSIGNRTRLPPLP